MDRHASRINHLALVLFGLLLLAAGGLALARGLGAFGAAARSDPLITEPMRRYAAAQGWFWPAVAAVAVVVALLGLAWLAAQLRSDRLPDLPVEPDERGGTTRVSAGAVTDALEDEIGKYPGVRGVHARLLGRPRSPRLRLKVSYERHADLADLRRRIGDQAVARLRTALDRESLPAVVRLRVVSGGETRRRVV
ncbi:hypothetical protein GCM10023085_13230 [Actinomadura viridis]|uniref:Alkaline shock response membrane anchor protein AmaP n=1 Tax=Actinomadura viridis TaxID=58110 RepID=A0A931DVW6_9ACTN|nr:alkaline shock response membrane anchor protein AmaP [Actinomadura viridis]MBG6093698.1 hypothetical protein [Actinomadura viridis]